ncbi:hypothetical protein T492DRAFT_1114223, partial [Pavlovales sp. CCMP2436]
LAAAQLLLLLLLHRPSTAALVVVEGPHGLHGFALASPPYQFTYNAVDTRVRAPLALVEMADFEYGFGRIAGYRGIQSLAGKIVLHLDPPLEFCSAEQLFVCSAHLACWAGQRQTRKRSRSPSRANACNMWSLGDTRSLAHPVAVDVTSVEMVPLLAALHAGHELVAELSPSAFAGRSAYGSWWYWLLSALVIVKFHAFVRADGGLRASVPVLMLLLELWLCLLRFVLCTVDPFYEQRLLPFREALLALSQMVTLATVSSSLFLVFFADAVASSDSTSLPPPAELLTLRFPPTLLLLTSRCPMWYSAYCLLPTSPCCQLPTAHSALSLHHALSVGIPSVRIVNPRYKRGLLWINLVVVASYGCFDKLTFTVRPEGNDGRLWGIVKIVHYAVLFPLAITVMASVTAWRVRTTLRAAVTPPRIVVRITNFISRAIVIEFALIVLGLGSMMCVEGPRATNIVLTSMLHSLFIAKR